MLGRDKQLECPPDFVPVTTTINEVCLLDGMTGHLVLLGFESTF